MAELYIGLMSGTSLDGVDVALVDFADGASRLIAAHCTEYTSDLRADLRRLCYADQTRLTDVGRLDAALGEFFADCVTQLLDRNALSPGQITAIGSHGQTLFHAPDGDFPFTWQIGDPHRLAQRTGISVVADFRRRDIAAGGQGAPLAPAFHRAFFGQSDADRAVVNIGGIANLSVIPAGHNLPCLGFDTGPGNTLMDAWIHKHRGLLFDANGDWARTGVPIPELLAAMLKEPYFAMKPPKSTGQERFSSGWLADHLVGMSSRFKPEDVQATLCELTALTIAAAVARHAPLATSLVICGGGAYNAYLLETIARVSMRQVQTTEVLGIPPEWVEATGFAWLARQRWLGLPSNEPGVTGARHRVSLGVICD